MSNINLNNEIIDPKLSLKDVTLEIISLQFTQISNSHYIQKLRKNYW